MSVSRFRVAVLVITVLSPSSSSSLWSLSSSSLSSSSATSWPSLLYFFYRAGSFCVRAVDRCRCPPPRRRGRCRRCRPRLVVSVLLSLTVVVYSETLLCYSCGGTAVARPRWCGPCSSRGPAIQLLAPQKALVVPFVGQREFALEQDREGEKEKRGASEREKREESYRRSVGVVNIRGVRGTHTRQRIIFSLCKRPMNNAPEPPMCRIVR